MKRFPCSDTLDWPWIRFLETLVSSPLAHFIIVEMIRRFSTTRPSRLFRWLELYEEFVGLKEVKRAQTTVNDVIETSQEEFL